VALPEAIDDICSEDLGHHGINLPQLIVCSDQSLAVSELEQDCQTPFDRGVSYCQG
jgi:hypothetical protein